ncbi:hypothetical protein MLD38_004665 [Melastoma candidum]|nr:hypothetical protein MLD38_004665 [Melastoma candidum]
MVPLTGVVRYKECMRNHAASMGSHIVDGCGEFMPGGEEGSPEFFKCAACECHRNFHRKETDGVWQPYSSSSHFYSIATRSNGSHRAIVSPPTQHPHQTIFQPTPINAHQHRSFSFGISNSPAPASGQPVMMAFGGGGAEESSSEDLAVFNAHDLGLQTGQVTTSKKRFRTKFTQQQKEKMVEFAEKLGWRMQKQDGQEVVQFCNEVGVKRQVFKVWMHNKKQSLKKQQM